MRILALGAIAAVALALAPIADAREGACLLAAGASAANPDRPPAGFRITANEAVAIARRTKAGRQAAGRPVPVPACDTWLVQYIAGGEVENLVVLDGRDGRVRKAWTGHQARWPMARGSGRLFVGAGTAPIVVGLTLLSIAAFVDPRRPRRGQHLDVFLLVAVGISLIPFARGEMGLSTPVAMLALALLFARLVQVARRPAAAEEPLSPWLSPRWLLAGAAALLAGRAAFTAFAAHVSDVGFLSVFGAQSLLDGFPVYSGSSVDLDAYGPATHVAYLPFTALFPLEGGFARGGDEAARSAAIAFDVLTAVVLFAIGRRLRPGAAGHALGAALAFAWAANPLGFYQVAASTNDGLVGLLLALAVLAVASPVGRGVACGLAGAAKWVPFVLVPLFAAGTRRLERRDALMVTLGVVAAVAAVTIPLMPDGGPREIYDVSLGGLASLDSPFTIWGLWELPGWLRHGALAAAGGFGVATAFRPRDRTPATVAALAAAAVIAVQLALPYWSYAYVSWFLPCALIGLLARSRSA